MTEAADREGAMPDRREEDRAQELVREVSEAWYEQAGFETPQGTLRDRTSTAMATEASHRMRQVLSQLGTELSLAAEDSKRSGEAGAFLDRLPKVEQALERARGILDTYLEEHQPVKLMLDLDIEVFDLAHELTRRLEASGAFEDPVPVAAHLDPAFIEGDAFKLLDVLTTTIHRFQGMAQPDDTVVVRLISEAPHVRGFIGLLPDRLDANELLDELNHPKESRGPTIDSLYARAVFERHGGSIYVDRSDQDGVGFGFTLPMTSSQEAPA